MTSPDNLKASLCQDRPRSDPARVAARMSEILVSGVSTRKYARVLPAIAASAGIAKSSVSRAVKGASEASLRQLMERSFNEHDIVAVYRR